MTSSLTRWVLTFAGIFTLIISGCQSRKNPCLEANSTRQYLTTPSEVLPTPNPVQLSTPILMKVNGQTIPIDRVIEGPLCNDIWKGTIYVSCNVQVYAWQEEPLFLKNCDLTISPGTVVYVAYHNETAYYNGCSCHTGQTANP